MDLIAVGTLVAALIAAVGAVWAAVISQRQLSLAKETTALPLPIVEATVSAVQEQPDWITIHIRTRNRADVALDLLRATLVVPANVGLLSDEAAHGPRTHPLGDWPMLVPLPAERAQRHVDVVGHMDRVGSDYRGGGGPFAMATVYAHCPLPRLMDEPQPRLSLEMRWRDHTTKTFAMAVNIIKPNTA